MCVFLLFSCLNFDLFIRLQYLQKQNILGDVYSMVVYTQISRTIDLLYASVLLNVNSCTMEFFSTHLLCNFVTFPLSIQRLKKIMTKTKT